MEKDIRNAILNILREKRDITGIGALANELAAAVEAVTATALPMLRFRPHRGALADAMLEEFIMPATMEALTYHINNRLGLAAHQISVEIYDSRPDDRIGWPQTWLVKCQFDDGNFSPIGFTDRNVIDTAPPTPSTHVDTVGHLSKLLEEARMVYKAAEKAGVDVQIGHYRRLRAGQDILAALATTEGKS